MADSNIAYFDRADSLSDNDLLVVLHGGKVMSLPGSVLEQYASDQSDRVYVGSDTPSDNNYNVWFDTTASKTNPTVKLRDADGNWNGISGVGVPGQAVGSIARTSGTGAKGTTDTYTMYLADGTEVGSFTVYNGSDGKGTVNSINNIEPDDGGNVDLNAGNIPLSDDDTVTVKKKLESMVESVAGKSGDVNIYPEDIKMQAKTYSSVYLMLYGYITSGAKDLMVFLPGNYSGKTVTSLTLADDDTTAVQCNGKCLQPASGTSGNIIKADTFASKVTITYDLISSFGMRMIMTSSGWYYQGSTDKPNAHTPAIMVGKFNITVANDSNSSDFSDAT